METTVQPETTLLDLLGNEEDYSRLIKKLKPAEHPIIGIPTIQDCRSLVELYGDHGLVNFFQRREQTIAQEKRNPYYFGYEPQQWKDSDELLKNRKELLILGGNRAGKSEYAAKRCMQRLVEHPGSMVWCLSTTHESSVRDQQRIVYKYLPLSLKKSPRNRVARVLYSQARGFTDRVFVLNNGSECRFLNYQQDINILEGGQIDLAWPDELIPVDWLVSLRGRTVDRRGKIITTFTPVNGWTNTVSEYVTGAKVIRDYPCEVFPTQRLWPGLKVGRVPYTMSCMNDRAAVIFYQPKDNPYIPYDELLKVWAGKPMSEFLIRVHGVTSKTSGNVFPRFGQQNIIKPEDIPIQGSNYNFIDFAWNRNWAQIWIRVTSRGHRRFIYVYREWPDYDTYGEWVVNSEKPDGAKGPAQATLGYGIGDYKILPRKLEGKGEHIEERFGDPRSGASQQIREDGDTTLFEMLETGENPIYVSPVATAENNHHILHGVNLINKWLEYDPDKPVDMFNQPELYISEKCQNVIACMKIWTGQDGAKGASKDFIDLMRYAAMVDPDDVSGRKMMSYGGGAY